MSGGVPLPSRVGAGRLAHADRAASVIAVWGPAGAPGRTTVAINLAAEIAAAGHTVALVDADPYGGAIAPSLGLLDEAPGFASACRLAGGDALDRAELERIAQRYSAPRASFDVLTGLGRPEPLARALRERVTAALEAMPRLGRVRRRRHGLQPRARRGDHERPVRAATQRGDLRRARRRRPGRRGRARRPGRALALLRGHAELVDLVEPERIDVVVNRVRTSALGIDAHGQVRQTLRRFGGIADATLLPHDGKADGCRDPHGAHAARRRAALAAARGAPRLVGEPLASRARGRARVAARRRGSRRAVRRAAAAALTPGPRTTLDPCRPSVISSTPRAAAVKPTSSGCTCSPATGSCSPTSRSPTS